MKESWAAVTKHWLALAGLVLTWLLAIVVPRDHGVVAITVAVIVTGAVAALIGPSHPLRNGTLAGPLPVVAAPARWARSRSERTSTRKARPWDRSCWSCRSGSSSSPCRRPCSGFSAGAWSAW